MAKQYLTRRRVNFSARLKIGAWRGFFRRGFHKSVDRREKFLLVCLSTVMEVVGKFCLKKLLAAVAFVRLRDNCNVTGV